MEAFINNAIGLTTLNSNVIGPSLRKITWYIVIECQSYFVYCSIIPRSEHNVAVQFKLRWWRRDVTRFFHKKDYVRVSCSGIFTVRRTYTPPRK